MKYINTGRRGLTDEGNRRGKRCSVVGTNLQSKEGEVATGILDREVDENTIVRSEGRETHKIDYKWTFKVLDLVMLDH